MHINQLIYLVEISKRKSISSASKILHISQPALSKSIAKLEEEFGTKIFLRLRTGLIPTEIGKTIICKAEEIIRKFQELNKISEENHALENNTITLSSLPFMFPLLSQTIHSLKKEKPNIQIEITEKSSEEVYKDILGNSVDLGFLRINEDIMNDKKLEYQKVMEIETCVCVNKNSKLALKKHLTPKDIIDFPVIIYDGIYNKDIKEIIENSFKPPKKMNLFFMTWT